ncbi:hypothetical protein B566_EDAN006141 [Ephemera danica]|nr:hypothetical protein B566_EDAN006141 [Ephemera danica]
MKLSVLACFLAAVVVTPQVRGHGILVDPPGRASMWRYGYSTPANYDDSQYFCGGFQKQWEVYGGKCGECGDEYGLPRPRSNENGGKYGKGIITRHYKAGQDVSISVEITANHMGYFRFSLCQLNSTTQLETEDCFKNRVLQLSNGAGTDYKIGTSTGPYTVRVRLPAGFVCPRCVLQWHYNTGNSWGTCADGSGAMGCGKQESFRSSRVSSVVQWEIFRGRCGECGDTFGLPRPRSNENMGKYGRGIVSRRYRTGQEITAVIKITANHKGWFRFSLCPLMSNSSLEQESCFKRNVLQLADGSGTEYQLPHYNPGVFTVKLRLPPELTTEKKGFHTEITMVNNQATMFLACMVLVMGLQQVLGHGYLWEPPNRASMWRQGYSTPHEYNDMEFFCGGRGGLERNGGRCGLCGDPYDNPRPRNNENTGKYGRGVVSRSYHSGQTIGVHVLLTQSHFGWFEFSLCRLNHGSEREEEHCFQTLQLADGSTRFQVPHAGRREEFRINVRLPPGLTCQRCVLRWHYRTDYTLETYRNLISCALALVALSNGHGYMADPPNRASMWRYGYDTPPQYNDNQFWCGSLQVQWMMYDGKCGECGDEYGLPRPRSNENGGTYGLGIITRRYKAGQTIDVTVELSSNHRGWFQFSLCPLSYPTELETEACFQQHVLEVIGGSGTQYYITNDNLGPFPVSLRLPAGLTCQNCVLQWHYNAGKSCPISFRKLAHAIRGVFVRTELRPWVAETRRTSEAALTLPSTLNLSVPTLASSFQRFDTAQL